MGPEGQVGFGAKRPKITYGDYSTGIERVTVELGGKFKAFDQRALLAAWSGLGGYEDVKAGVCRALSAAYLCRQYVKLWATSEDGGLHVTDALLHIKDEDRLLFVTGAYKFFSIFKEGRLTGEDRKTMKDLRGIAPRNKQPFNQSGLSLQKGDLLIEEDGRLREPLGPTGQRVRTSDKPLWRIRRVEHVFEVQEKNRPKNNLNDDQLLNMTTNDIRESAILPTMKCFSKTLTRFRSGKIRLAGPYDDWIWNMELGYGFFMCWVEDHAFALAMRTVGSWGGYTVKFFDSNFGECKFKTAADFQTFVGAIASGFLKRYHQGYMDYIMFC